MKRKFLLMLALFITGLFCVASAQQKAKITPSGIGYLEYLPKNYHSNSNKYPVVVFLHGIKEKGTASENSNRVKKDLGRVSQVGIPRYVKSGKEYPFILISPQLKNTYGTWPANYVMEVLDYVKTKLRIDEKRIYLTGLSLGGFGVWRTVGQYPHVFAAIAPICPGGSALGRANEIAEENVAVWGFHGSIDKVAPYTWTTNMINAINSAPKKPNPLAKITIFRGMGHNVWDKAYLETNVLTWLLSFRKGGSASPPPSNHEPEVDAGPDKTIILPEDSVYIEGTAADSDGEVVSYQWTKVSGEPAGMIDTDSTRFGAYDLNEGTYVFRLTAEDNEGATSHDDVIVTVKASVNKIPIVSAGADKTITLPSNSVTLVGTAADPDGEIRSYSWAKTSGGHAVLNNQTTAELQVSNLDVGVYVFRFSATDDGGAEQSDDVIVTVQAKNKFPVANAGSDRILRLPDNAITLEGSATDEDGAVASYHWSQISGDAAAISNAASERVNVSNLKVGVYVFRFSATDDKGAVSTDDVKVNVLKEFFANMLPTVYSGPDRSPGIRFNRIYLNGISWYNARR